MAGKNCVGICSDMRLGQQALTVARDFEKVRAGPCLRCVCEGCTLPFLVLRGQGGRCVPRLHCFSFLD